MHRFILAGNFVNFIKGHCLPMAATDRLFRFAFLSQTWPEDEKATISGSSVQVYYIAKELAQRGFPVLVILSSHPGFRDIKEGCFSIVSIFEGTALRHNLSRSWQQKAKKILQEFKPDIVYQRGKLPESVTAASARKNGTLFVWLSNADNSGERWKFIEKRWAKRHQVKTLLPRLAEAAYADVAIERSIRKADIAIAQTEVQQRSLARNFSLHASVLGSGHPIPVCNLASNKSRKVLWLANLTPMKQPLLFAELAGALRDENAEFILAGKAPDPSVLQDIDRLSQQVPSFKYVGGVGLKSGDALFRQAALFVSTSWHGFEGIPNTFIQACKHGTPIISLNNDPDGIIQKEGIGEVVHSFDDLVAAVRRWLHDDKRRMAAGKRAYEFALREFDIRRIVDQLLVIVHKSLSEKNKLHD